MVERKHCPVKVHFHGQQTLSTRQCNIAEPKGSACYLQKWKSTASKGEIETMTNKEIEGEFEDILEKRFGETQDRYVGQSGHGRRI